MVEPPSSFFLTSYRTVTNIAPMTRNTKREILDTALDLFSRNGYGDTSMSDIASCLEITKAALYKHFASKEEILSCLIREMEEEDLKRAEEHCVSTTPDGRRDGGVEKNAFLRYALSQFSYWTENKKGYRYRRLLSLERFKNPLLGEKWNQNFLTGPLDYTKASLEKMGFDNGEERAFRLWGAMFLSYSLCDFGRDGEIVGKMLEKELKTILEVDDEISQK